MDIPFRLSEGLYLEESDQLLPWVPSLHQLTKRGGSPTMVKGGISKIDWKPEIVFGGLKVEIQARMHEYPFFSLMRIRINPYKTTIEEYDANFLELKNIFGLPHELGKTEYDNPWVKWHFEKITISLGIAEHFMDYVTFVISKKWVKQCALAIN